MVDTLELSNQDIVDYIWAWFLGESKGSKVSQMIADIIDHEFPNPENFPSDEILEKYNSWTHYRDIIPWIAEPGAEEMKLVEETIGLWKSIHPSNDSNEWFLNKNNFFISPDL